MWWWGEQEAVHIQKWITSTLAAFSQQTGYAVTPTLLDTDKVISQFTAAAPTGAVPDVQFFWNGIYHMESVWKGYVEPLTSLIAGDVLERSGATQLSVFQGKYYRIGFYAIGIGMAYNKDLFDRAQLNADDPPKTWDAFIDACDKLKGIGAIPIGGGVKDGFLGEQYMVNALTQNLDSSEDALRLFIGELDWREPKYHEHWIRLEELRKHKFINNDITTLELFQGAQLFDTGRAAMSFNTTPSLPNSQQQLGADKVGFMVMPAFGTGKLSGAPILDTQGFGIPARSANKVGAAALLEFMHTPERVQAMWVESKQLPADKGFDGSIIDNPLLKGIWERWVRGTSAPYIADLMPTLFWTDAMQVASQKILAGTLTGAASGDLAHAVTQRWKTQNPDIVRNYAAWAQDLRA